jgi:DNA-binding IclR family transcriptional regulator
MNTTEAGSLKRGVALLKLMATAGPRGLALTELAAAAGIPHPSAHRVLTLLIEERLAEQNRESRRYRLGPLAFELGVAGSTMYDIRDLCEPAMRELSRETDDTCYLIVRSGFDAVCMHRVEGSFPIQALVLQVGSRRPLGVGAGGLAILSEIESGERAAIIGRVAPALSAFGDLNEAGLTEACERAREAGMAVIRNRVTLGIAAVGVCFRDSMGQPIAALSVAALTQRMTARRIARIGELLRGSSRGVEQLLRRA